MGAQVDVGTLGIMENKMGKYGRSNRRNLGFPGLINWNGGLFKIEKYKTFCVRQ